MSLELGCLVKERYQVKQIFKQTPSETVYLTQDQVRYGEDCILREFISTEVGKAAIVGEAFQQQLTKLQTLKHPQIQQIEDFFWDSKGLFIVQSYIEGQNYQELLRHRSPLTEPEAIALLNQILSVLSDLHSQQITHRDISASHILLRSHDNLPVLTNFGVMTDILTQMGGETAEIKLSERVRRLSGAIISPGIDEDLYALAVTVVMLLTDQELEVLFNSQTQIWEWENWKLVSDQFAYVLNRMLAMQPINRFKSADAVLQALNTLLTATVPVAPPPPIVPTAPIPSPTPLNQSIPNSVQPTYNSYNSYQQPTVLSPPDINTFSQPQTTHTTRPFGSKDWLKAIIAGVVIGLCVIGASFWWLTRQRSSQSTQQASVASSNPSPSAANSSPLASVGVTPSPTATNFSPPASVAITPSPTATNFSPPASVAITPSPTATNFSPPASVAITPSPTTSFSIPSTTDGTAQSTPSTSISQQEAVNLVNAWLQAKRQMFAPPYNRQIAAEITTGKQYNDAAGSNGTIDWLQNNNAYYQYGVQKIEGVDEFVSNNNQAAIRVRVTEQRRLLKDGKIDREQSDFNTITVFYYLQFVNGSWKIADSKVIK
ncbi:MAG: DUF4101 domain-containing protein [Iphinoe sp. HA4291-MV1]|jgi:serine/threonine-protein kinase|nr:DUF4101 domain-containing protein [Iphinoe sp. HA4291-MV1]